VLGVYGKSVAINDKEEENLDESMMGIGKQI
jgi:hypothetical protein